MPRDRKALRLGLGLHGAELVDGEQLPKAAYPLLAKNDGAGGTQPHRDCKNPKDGREQKQAEKRQDEIHPTAQGRERPLTPTWNDRSLYLNFNFIVRNR